MMRGACNRETPPESAKIGQVAPTCRAWLHDSVSKAAASRSILHVRAHMWHHICALTIERRGFPAGLVSFLAGYDASDVGGDVPLSAGAPSNWAARPTLGIARG